MNLNNLDRTYDYEIFILEEVRLFVLFTKLYTVYGSTSAVFPSLVYVVVMVYNLT